jgi:serine/threonine protein kinase
MAANFNDEVKQKLNISRRLWPWSIDIWSLGVILMEMVIGYPIWMSYNSITNVRCTIALVYYRLLAIPGPRYILLILCHVQKAVRTGEPISKISPVVRTSSRAFSRIIV